MIRLRQYHEPAKLWKYVLEQLNSLSSQLERKERAAREIAARLPQAFDDTQVDRIAAQGKQDGNVCYTRQGARCRTARHDKIYVAAIQFMYHLPQRTWIAGRVVQFKDNVLSCDVASPTQSFPKAIQKRIGLRFGRKPKDAINPCRLLRLRSARPGHRTTCKRNEISASHVNPSHCGPRSSR